MENTMNIPENIPENELRWQFARSSGSGGQNVNKRSTKAQLWWNIQESQILDEEQKKILLQKLATRITNDGELYVDEEGQRTQEQNRETALNRLTQLVNDALKPEKKREKTSVPRQEKKHRLEEKKIIGRKKEMRRKPEF